MEEPKSADFPGGRRERSDFAVYLNKTKPQPPTATSINAGGSTVKASNMAGFFNPGSQVSIGSDNGQTNNIYKSAVTAASGHDSESEEQTSSESEDELDKAQTKVTDLKD